MATAIEISRALTAQGADAGSMATVLESLSNAGITPVWGAGAVGADLTPDEVAMIILGATAPIPERAAEHVAKVGELIRHDGRSLGQVLTDILAAEPHEIYTQWRSRRRGTRRGSATTVGFPMSFPSTAGWTPSARQPSSAARCSRWWR